MKTVLFTSIYALHQMMQNSLSSSHSNSEEVNAEDLENEFEESSEDESIFSYLIEANLKDYSHSMTNNLAPLPAHRLQSHIRPFTNVGIDYFFRGRRQEKKIRCVIHLSFNQSSSSRISTLSHRRLLYRSLPTFCQSPRSSLCRL